MNWGPGRSDRRAPSPLLPDLGLSPCHAVINLIRYAGGVAKMIQVVLWQIPMIYVTRKILVQINFIKKLSLQFNHVRYVQCVLKSAAKRAWPLEVWAWSQMCVIVSPHNLQRSLKETPWDLCGFLLTLFCELMGCWGKTNIGRENMSLALHKSSLLTVYDIGLEWPNIVPITFASQNLEAFWDFVPPVRACWPCQCKFLLSVVHDHWRQLPSFCHLLT